MRQDKRLLIFFFYDKDGIVDRYVPYMLEDMNRNVSEILIVVNGELQDSGRRVLETITNNILVRENKGFDVWAYKTGLEYYGWESLSEFDEVIMMNATIMGPLYPFSEMFSEMQEKELDFWGLTLYHGAPFDPFGKIKYGYLPIHIQSHFIAVRHSMLNSDAFHSYWDSMPMITCYEEAVCYHEAIFTKDFSDLGFTWGAYIDTRDILGDSYCPLLMSPLQLIRDRRCPIIKRRSFFHSYTDFMNYTAGEMTVEVVRYIQQNLDYDLDFIWENIIRLQNQADIKRINHFNYILPTGVLNVQRAVPHPREIALVMHIYFEDLIEECAHYAMSMPPDADIIVTTDSELKQEKIQSRFSNISCRRLTVIRVDNRGRDVSALLVGVKGIINNYDYVCFVHDKKVGQLDFAVKGRSFSHKCFENLLPSEFFVENVIQAFEDNPRLGLLVPPPPIHAEYYPTIGAVDWGCNYDTTVSLADTIGINVDFNKDKEPIAPLGTMFWFRPVAMKKLFERDWDYKDFPTEPNHIDGTLLHAIERLYPFVVQDAGYYPAWLLSDRYASIEITNLYFLLRELNRVSFQIYGTNTSYGLISIMQQAIESNQYNVETDKIFRRLLKQKIKRAIPSPIWEFIKKIYYRTGKNKVDWLTLSLLKLW